MKNKTQKILAIILLANVLAVSFAFAQTPPQTQEIEITSADFVAADRSAEACTSFGRSKVEPFFRSVGKNYTTKSISKVDIYGKPVNPPQIICIFVDAETNRQTASIQETEKQFRLQGARQNAYAAAINEQNRRHEDGAMWGGVVGWILSSTFKLLTALLGVVTTIALTILQKVVAFVPGDLPPLVSQGWIIVRDVMNLVFILALITMSLATILRVEAYNYKKLLGKLILMALLINFSLVISKALIDIGDTFMRVVAQGANFFNYWQFLKDVAIPNSNVYADFATNVSSEVIQSGLQMLYAIVAAVTFIAIAALLLIRLVGLWFLAMVSPIAFALNILPGTKQYAKQWWDTFFKYLIWGPVSLFFLRLGNSLIQQRNSSNTGGDHTMDYLFIIVLTWAAFLMAKKAGMYGAGAVTSAAEKSARWTGNAFGKYGARNPIPFKIGSTLVGGDRNKFGKTLGKLGDLQGKGTAYVEGLPKTTLEPLARSEKARQKLVADQSRKLQLQMGTYGDFGDKDSAATLSFKDIYGLAKDNKLDAEKVDNLLDNNPKAKDALLLAMHDEILGGNDQKLKKDLYEKVFISHFLSNGGKLWELDLARKFYYKEEDGKITKGPEVQVSSVKGEKHANDVNEGPNKRKAHVNLEPFRKARKKADKEDRVVETVAGAAAGGAAGAAAATVLTKEQAQEEQRRARLEKTQAERDAAREQARKRKAEADEAEERAKRARAEGSASQNQQPDKGRGTGNYPPGRIGFTSTPASHSETASTTSAPSPVMPTPSVPPPPAPKSSSGGSAASVLTSAAEAQERAAKATSKAAEASAKAAEANIESAKASAQAIKNAADISKQTSKQSASAIKNAAEQSRTDLSGLESEISRTNEAAQKLSDTIESSQRTARRQGLSGQSIDGTLQGQNRSNQDNPQQ